MRGNNRKSAAATIGGQRHRTNGFVFVIALLSILRISSPARADVLVSSFESHSIEWFTTSGQWIDTFATTGRVGPIGLAQSPITGEVFATSGGSTGCSNTILRYPSNGALTALWDSFTVPDFTVGGSTVAYDTCALAFDTSGNLYVATAYAVSSTDSNVIYKYAASSLSSSNPTPIATWPTDMIRGDQLAFDALGNLCVASFPNEDVKCFDPVSHNLVFDYRSELVAFSGGAVEPGGFAFDTSNRLYSDNTFSAEIVREPIARGGSVAALADNLTPQAEMLTLASGSLYVTSYVISPTDENPDVIYKINTISGAITNFITSHIWGPYQMIFAKVTKSR
jgi:hypothetical protein